MQYSKFFKQLFQNIINTDHPFSFAINLWEYLIYLIKHLQNTIYLIPRHSYPIFTTYICDYILDVIFSMIYRLSPYFKHIFIKIYILIGKIITMNRTTGATHIFTVIIICLSSQHDSCFFTRQSSSLLSQKGQEISPLSTSSSCYSILQFILHNNMRYYFYVTTT